ncbi:MAG: gamma-glutamyltransferase family protein, partial [Bacteroidia bacterium]|nr:gamma-glutamyltransferase family protein [Bacteroidia bacterium]
MKSSLLFLITIILTFPGFSQDRILGKSFATRSEVFAQQGVASTSQPLATQVALDILKQGGNAIDAAIAANAALGLMEPTGCGIGGDLFVIIWHAESGKLYGLNASGRSPKELNLEWFLSQGYTEVPYYGALAVSVPGCVDGWFSMHEKFGTMGMAELLQPAIQYCRKGYPVTPTVAYYMNRTKRDFSDNPGFMETYYPDRKDLEPGDIRKNPDLAATLEIIAAKGREGFYQGSVAQAIAESVREQGGFLSVEDLASHRSEWVEPVSVNYRGYDVWELPPNGQGTAALQMLNILEGFDIRGMRFGTPEYIHLFTEAKKLAFEDRAKFYTDPDFYDVPIDLLVSKAYADERRELIDPEKAANAFPAGELEKGNTIYMTVADHYGNMVSLIQSNYAGMGSGVIPSGFGFMLQNRGALFALQEDHANRFEPGKRPFHTIIPGFITKDGNPWVS